eukprot:g23776.t1
MRRLHVRMQWKQLLARRAPVVRFKMKVFCPECGLRVQPSDVGEVREMRDVCKTMWRKFMQLDDRHCPLSGWDDVGDGTQAVAAAPLTVPMSVPPGAAVVEFKVDQGVVGFLIGKGGETLRSMEVSSTATIKIDQSTKEMGYSMVRITGSQQAVAVAKALCDGRVNEKPPGAQPFGAGGVSDSGNVGWETQIDQSNVGFFIGKQGEPGLREASEMVKYRLDQVKEAAVQRAPAGEYEELSIAQGQVGAIIGKGGETLRQIKAESGAIIVLSQETKGQGFSTVRFAGNFEQVAKAKELVQIRLAEREQQQSQDAPPNSLVPRATMAEASRDLAQGTIEVMVSESVCAKERMEAREVEEAYQKFEESEEHIKELLQRGAISLDEARRLRTRGKMHEQEALRALHISLPCEFLVQQSSL